MTACALAAAPAISPVDSMLNQAQFTLLKGDQSTAISLASKAIELEPTNAQCFYVRGRFYAGAKEPAKAVADFNRALDLEPRGAEIYQLRGIERFKIGQIQESITDFDRFLKYVPKQEPFHWHRGIAYYFAGRYEEGRRQFELRQKQGTNTIENALWHFLCTARASGLEKARTSMLPKQDDSMLVMRRIYDLFAGHAKPEEVMSMAQANYASTAQLNRQLFFAHFYLSFYYELAGEQKKALEHAKEATGECKVDNFMGDVASLHAAVLGKLGS